MQTYCSRHILGNFTSTEGVCSCSIPCHRTKFDPSLSYAQISKMNIAQQVMKSEEQEEKVRQQFYDATEVSQRVKKDIVQVDQNTFNQIQTESLIFLDTLNRVINELSNLSAFSQDRKFADLIQIDGTPVGDLKTEISEYFQNAECQARNFLYQESIDDDYPEYMTNLWTVFSLSDDDSVASMITTCNTTTDACFYEFMLVLESREAATVTNHAFLSTDHIASISVAMGRIIEGMQATQDAIGVNTTFEQDLKRTCEIEINWFLNEGNATIEELIGHIDDFNDEWSSMPDGPFQSIDVFNYTKIAEASAKIIQLTNDDTFKEFIQQFQDEGSSQGDPCEDPMIQGIESCKCFGSKLDSHIHEIEDDMLENGNFAVADYNQIINRILTIQMFLDGIKSSFQNDVHPLLDYIESYAIGSVVKIELATLYDGITVASQMESFLSKCSDVKAQLITTINLLCSLETYTSRMQLAALESIFPVITVENYMNSSFGSLFYQHCDDPRYLEMCNNLTDDFSERYLDLQRAHYETLEDVLWGGSASVIATGNVLINSIAQLRSTLLKFYEANTINEQFY